MPLDALAPAWDVGPEVLLDQEGGDHAQRSVLLLDDDHDVSDLLPSLDIPVRCDDLSEWITTVYDRSEQPRFHQVPEVVHHCLVVPREAEQN